MKGTDFLTKLHAKPLRGGRTRDTYNPKGIPDFYLSDIEKLLGPPSNIEPDPKIIQFEYALEDGKGIIVATPADDNHFVSAIRPAATPRSVRSARDLL